MPTESPCCLRSAGCCCKIVDLAPELCRLYMPCVQHSSAQASLPHTPFGAQHSKGLPFLMQFSTARKWSCARAVSLIFLLARLHLWKQCIQHAMHAACMQVTLYTVTFLSPVSCSESLVPFFTYPVCNVLCLFDHQMTHICFKSDQYL